MKLTEFKQTAEAILGELEAHINKMPNKGDSQDESQKMCLKQAVNEVQWAINGVTDEDLVEGIDQQKRSLKLDNPLIADFMGWSKSSAYSADSPRYIEPEGDDSSFVTPYQMGFENDWHRLMPVIEKIQSLGYQVTITNNKCLIEDGIYIVSGRKATHKELISCVYDSVVDFIKQYNQEGGTYDTTRD